jgi:hypothetical protein
MTTTIRARIYARGWGGEICQLSIFIKLICQTTGDQFFLFLLKLDGCQVDLPNCCRVMQAISFVHMHLRV